MATIVEDVSLLMRDIAFALGYTAVYFTAFAVPALLILRLAFWTITTIKSWRKRSEVEYATFRLSSFRRLVVSSCVDYYTKGNLVIMEYKVDSLGGATHERECGVYGRNILEHARILIFADANERRTAKAKRRLDIQKNENSFAVLRSLKDSLTKRIEQEEATQAKAVGNMIEITGRIQSMNTGEERPDD